MLDWIRGEMLPDGMISTDDLELLHVTDDLEKAVQTVIESYGTRQVPVEPKKADAQ